MRLAWVGESALAVPSPFFVTPGLRAVAFGMALAQSMPLPSGWTLGSCAGAVSALTAVVLPWQKRCAQMNGKAGVTADGGHLLPGRCGRRVSTVNLDSCLCFIYQRFSHIFFLKIRRHGRQQSRRENGRVVPGYLPLIYL